MLGSPTPFSGFEFTGRIIYLGLRDFCHLEDQGAIEFRALRRFDPKSPSKIDGSHHPSAQMIKDQDASLDEGSNAAQDMLDLMLDRAESMRSPIDFWRGFLHTLHGALVLEMGEAELSQTLRDTLDVIPAIVAKHRSDTDIN